MYKKVNPDLHFVERERNTRKFWDENRIFEKSVKAREGGPMTARRPRTASRTSATWRRVRSRISSRVTAR